MLSWLKKYCQNNFHNLSILDRTFYPGVVFLSVMFMQIYGPCTPLSRIWEEEKEVLL